MLTHHAKDTIRLVKVGPFVFKSKTKILNMLYVFSLYIFGSTVIVTTN